MSTVCKDFFENRKRQTFDFEIANMKTDIMTGQVHSVCRMLARWSPCFHGGCSFEQAVQLFLLPTAGSNVTTRDCSTTNSAVVSIAGSEALRTCHGGSALPSLQSLSPLPNTTHLCVCVCRVEDHFMASPSLPFTSSTLLNSMWCHIPFLRSWASQMLRLLT